MSFSLEVPESDDTELKELFFKNYMEGDPESLELNDDNTYLVSLESSLNNLQTVLNGITTTGAMCQSFALEAHGVTGNFINAEKPIQMYSKIPTGTQYREAVEDLSTTIFGLIVAGIVAILAICYKLYKWIFGKDKGKETVGVPTSRLSKAAENSSDVESALNDIQQNAPKVAESIEKIVYEVNNSKKENTSAPADTSGKTSYIVKDIEIAVMNYQATKDDKNFRAPHLKVGDSALHDLIYNHDAFTHDVITDGPLMQLLYKASGAMVVWPLLLANTIEAVDANLSLVSASFKQINIREDMRVSALKALCDLNAFVAGTKGGNESALLKGVSYSLPFNNQKINPTTVSTMLNDLLTAENNSSDKKSFRDFKEVLSAFGKSKHPDFFKNVKKMLSTQSVDKFKVVFERLDEMRKSMDDLSASIIIDNRKILSKEDLAEEVKQMALITEKLKAMGVKEVKFPPGKGLQEVGNRFLFNTYRDIINMLHTSLTAYNNAFSVYNKVYMKIIMLNTQVVETMKDVRHVLKVNNLDKGNDELSEQIKEFGDIYKTYGSAVKKL